MSDTTIDMMFKAYKEWLKYATGITHPDHSYEEFKLINEYDKLLKKINKNSHCLVKSKKLHVMKKF